MFGIKYAVAEPLATVLNQVAEGSIQAVAALLWSLKRGEHSLSGAWLALNGMQRSIGQAAAAAKQHSIFLPGGAAGPSLEHNCREATPLMHHRAFVCCICMRWERSWRDVK